MPLVWRIKDHQACEACKALNGKHDGDGWTADLGPEVDLWIKSPDGTYHRKIPLDDRGYGRPQLHPECRCRVRYEAPRTT